MPGRVECIIIMVVILDGNSEHAEHVWRPFCHAFTSMHNEVIIELCIKNDKYLDFIKLSVQSRILEF